MTPLVFAPFLLAYLGAATLIVWSAVLDVSTIEANPEVRPVGWCSAAYRSRQGRPDRVPLAPVELPPWAMLDPEPWADRVVAVLVALLDPPPPAPAPAGALLLAGVRLFPVPPPAGTLNRYAEATAA